MRASNFVPVVLFIGVCCAEVSAAENVDVTKVASPQSHERHATIMAIQEQRKVTIDGLIDIVRKRIQADQPFGAMEEAVRLLGTLRAKEAVPVLVQNIDFQPPVIFDATRIIVPPCVQALIDIGIPSAQTIWAEHLLSATKEKLPLYLEVMKGVWGRDVCIFLLKEKLKGELTETEKVNLQAALDHPIFKEAAPEAGKK